MSFSLVKRYHAWTRFETETTEWNAETLTVDHGGQQLIYGSPNFQNSNICTFQRVSVSIAIKYFHII